MDNLELKAAGTRMYEMASDLFPICRSLTGDGVRETLAAVAKRLPIKVYEVATGTDVLDWQVPQEWNIRDAYIANLDGERIVDFQESNLHVVGYSKPVKTTLTLDELTPHLHTLPDFPDQIPYRTGYFNDDWGFCLSKNVLDDMQEEQYEVLIDSELTDGSLTYAEVEIPGTSEDEILLCAHTCHPSLANDNLSGIALLCEVARWLDSLGARRKLNYRLIFAPGTIGAITWLAKNQDQLQNIVSGLVVSCVGDDGGPLYKCSRRGDGLIDTAMAHVLKMSEIDTASVKEFWPYGYDERQYCSPGFNLPVGLFQRSQYGEFPEYHTSADNLDFISAKDLSISLDLVTQAITILETNDTFINLYPKGEPQLGRRGLYSLIGGDNDSAALQLAILWVLNMSDGKHSLLDIANRAETPYMKILHAKNLLIEAELLAPVSTDR